MKAIKEIYLGREDLEFVSKNEGRLPFLVDASLTKIFVTQIKYLSEESVNEMLAEKDKEIEILRQGEKALIDSIEILSGMVKNK